MNKELFVQNIKKYCELAGVKPTVACRESGVGSSFINNIESRNQTPSVEKVQMLAQYLGVTVSQLLGEAAYPGNGAGGSSAGSERLTPDEQHLINGYRSLNEDGQAYIRQTMELATETQRYKKIPDLSKLEGQA